MVKYRIIPYEKSHTDEILTFGMNDKLLENDASSEEGRIDYGIPGLSFTLLADNNIVLCGGITPLWDAVGRLITTADKANTDSDIDNIIWIFRF